MTIKYNDTPIKCLFFLSEQSLESARGESGEGGIGEDEVDKLNQELKDMRDSLAEKSKKLTERTEGAAKYDGFSLWVKIICRTYSVFTHLASIYANLWEQKKAFA